MYTDFLSDRIIINTTNFWLKSVLEHAIRTFAGIYSHCNQAEQMTKNILNSDTHQGMKSKPREGDCLFYDA